MSEHVCVIYYNICLFLVRPERRRLLWKPIVHVTLSLAHVTFRWVTTCSDLIRTASEICPPPPCQRHDKPFFPRNCQAAQREDFKTYASFFSNASLGPLGIWDGISANLVDSWILHSIFKFDSAVKALNIDIVWDWKNDCLLILL